METDTVHRVPKAAAPAPPPHAVVTRCTVFVVSPADGAGKRARALMNPAADFAVANRLHAPKGGGITLGEAFSFMSQLYFRGKLAYARAFANPPPAVGGVHVIAPGVGLMDPDATIGVETLRGLAAVPIDPRDPTYQRPFERDASLLAEALGPAGRAVFLGSMATNKYLEILDAVFGDTLLVPQDLIGRGSLSRGALLLRCAEAGTPLVHVGLGETPAGRLD